MRLFLFAAGLVAGMAPVARAQDHSAHMGHHMPATENAAPVRAPAAMPAPDAPLDHAADAYYDPTAMADARKQLARESGGMPASLLFVERLELRPGRGGDAYAWEGEGWIGGDIDRFTVKTEGEGALGGRGEQAELQLLWSHAVDPWFNLQAGARQDLSAGPKHTYAVLAIEGIAPYWFQVEGSAFLSLEGDLTARTEASYDQRVAQRLIAQPSAEVNLSAQDVPALRLGSGITSVELGFRLRYEIVREFAPYLGVNWERKLGSTARHTRDDGHDPGILRFVTGLRLWF